MARTTNPIYRKPIPTQNEEELLLSQQWIETQPDPAAYARAQQEIAEVLRAVRTKCRYCGGAWPALDRGWRYLKIDEEWHIVHICAGTDYIVRRLEDWEVEPK